MSIKRNYIFHAYIFFTAGISVIDESEPIEEPNKSAVAVGVELAYTVPEKSSEPQETEQCAEATNVSLEELMKQMKSL